MPRSLLIDIIPGSTPHPSCQRVLQFTRGMGQTLVRYEQQILFIYRIDTIHTWDTPVNLTGNSCPSEIQST
jgi:hypothetical protein